MNHRHRLQRTRWFMLRYFVAAVAIALVPSFCTAQEPLPSGGAATVESPLEAALARRGDLTLRKSSLEAALMTIAELWKVNIVAGEVNGQVNGVFKNAPLREILDSVLLGNGYGYRVVGESLVITPIAELGAVNPFFQSTAIALRNVKPSEIAPAVSVLSTPQGQIRPLDSANSLIVVDFPDRVQQIRELALKIDAASGGVPGNFDANGNPRPLKVMYRHLQFISADKASTALDAVLSQAGRVSVLQGDDRLIVADYEANLTMARLVLDEVDKPRPQVRIAALIYDISLADIEALGINWSHSLKGRTDANGDAQTSLSVDSITATPLAGGVTGGNITFANLSENLDLSAVLLAVQNANDARLLADPTVTVMDNEEASFESVSEIPYQQLTQTSAGGDIGTTAFRDAGIKLRVRPKISADGTIELDVAPEFSRLTGFTPGDNQPIIDRRTANTKLRVVNGQTIVIGGLRQRTDVGEFAGVPGLKDRRYIGHLFRSRQTDIRESELVVFISPLVVGYAPALSCREQLIVDTVDARLDHIPPAEGGPPGTRAYFPEGVPVPDEGVPTPHMLPTIEELPYDPELQSSNEAPLPAVAARPLPVRRLPITESFAVAEAKSQSASAEQPAPLRMSYDDRFRASEAATKAKADEKTESTETAAATPLKEKENSPWWRPFR